MKPTISFLLHTFKWVNRDIFDNSLPPIEFKIGNAASYSGKFFHPTTQIGFLRTTPNINPYIVISRRYDIPATQIEDIVIHELIHYYIYLSGIKDSSPHGKRFLEIMLQINRDHGRHISVSTRINPQTQATDTRTRKKYICISHLETGDLGITICGKTSVLRLHQAISRIPSVKKTEWHISINPWFNRFPMVRSCKIYKISHENYEKYLLDPNRRDTSRLQFQPPDSISKYKDV